MITRTTPDELRRAIERQRDNVLDLDVVVDDARPAVDHAVEAFRTVVRERDRVAGHLGHLVELADNDTIMGDTVTGSTDAEVL